MAEHQSAAGQRLGTAIGHLVVNAMVEGASYQEVIGTLDHLGNLARLNEKMKVDFTALARRVPQGTFGPRHPSTGIGE